MRNSFSVPILSGEKMFRHQFIQQGGEVVFGALSEYCVPQNFVEAFTVQICCRSTGARQLAASCQMSMILMNLPCTRDGLDQDPY